MSLPVRSATIANHARTGLNDPLQFLDGFVALPEVKEGQAVQPLLNGSISCLSLGNRQQPASLH
jgi:hypothetical protein